LACGGEKARTDQAIDQVTQGRELFGRHGCAVCHGEQGHGDGEIADQLTPKPRDFRQVSAYRQGSRPAEVARTIEIGVAGGSTMPAYPHLSATERELIAAYVVHLQGEP
jgi:mono/diheme cytochrome c family protein